MIVCLEVSLERVLTMLTSPLITATSYTQLVSAIYPTVLFASTIAMLGIHSAMLTAAHNKGVCF